MRNMVRSTCANNLVLISRTVFMTLTVRRICKMTHTLTMLEFSTDEDFRKARAISRQQGYEDSCAYTSSSDIPGMYLVPLRPSQRDKVVVKTEEFGFVVIDVID